MSADLVREGVQQIATIFELNNYMPLSFTESIKDGVQLTIPAPATLWSQQVLALRGDLRNDYEAKVICAWMRRCNVPVTYTTRFLDGNQVVHTFKWARGQIA